MIESKSSVFDKLSSFHQFNIKGDLYDEYYKKAVEDFNKTESHNKHGIINGLMSELEGDAQDDFIGKFNNSITGELFDRF